MTDRQEDQLSMFDEVITYSDANTAATSGIAAYATTLTAFKTVVGNIKSKDQQSAQLIGGFSDTKADLKKKAADEGAKIAKAVFSYASSINDLTLKGKVKFAPSELQKKRDDALPQVLNDIKSIADALVTVTPPATNPLEPYGVTAARLTAFGTMITNYSNSISNPRNAIINRKTILQELDTLFIQANAILKDQLDGLAFQVGGTFYMGYKNARIIVDSATRSTRIIGIVKNNVTNNPISGVKAEVTISSDNDTKTYTAFTDTDGGYILKVPKPGTHVIKFIKTGYADQQVSDVKLILGETTTQNATMVPISS